MLLDLTSVTDCAEKRLICGTMDITRRDRSPRQTRAPLLANILLFDVLVQRSFSREVSPGNKLFFVFMLWFFLLTTVVGSASGLGSTTACPSESFYPYSQNTSADYDVVVFDSGVIFTSTNVRIDSSPCTNIHPKSRVVMVRSIAMGDFLASKFSYAGYNGFWSGLFKPVFSNTDARSGWVWMDDKNVSSRTILWAGGEPNDYSGNERTTQWWYTTNPKGHVDVPSGYSTRMICELWSKSFRFEVRIVDNLIRV
jgi:hypothetical protein